MQIKKVEMGKKRFKPKPIHPENCVFLLMLPRVKLEPNGTSRAEYHRYFRGRTEHDGK